MIVIHTANFDRLCGKLPKDVQRLFHIQEKRFLNNWRDVRLHTKKLHGLEEVFSFRVTRNWRVLFYFQNPTITIFFEIDNRKDIYR